MSIVPLLLLALLATPTSSSTEDDAAAPPPTAAELEALVAPVALLPDLILSLVLEAALDVASVEQAAAALEVAAVQPEDGGSVLVDGRWSEGVQTLLHVPALVARLADQSTWTARLGEANRTRPAELRAAVDAVRERAHAAGNLVADEAIVVERVAGRLRIALADPAVLRLPTYETEALFEQHDDESDDWLTYGPPVSIAGYRTIAAGLRSERWAVAPAGGRPLPPASVGLPVFTDDSLVWGMSYAVGVGVRRARTGIWRLADRDRGLSGLGWLIVERRLFPEHVEVRFR